jgi:hypothetical protein
MCQCFSWKSNTHSLPYRQEHPSECSPEPKKAHAGEYPNTG